MRNRILTTAAVLGLAAGSVFAQGVVSFNLVTLNPVPLVSNNLTSAYLDSSYRAQLFYGATADSSTFTPVWSSFSGTVSTPFTFGTTPGLINDNRAKYTDPFIVDGSQTGYFQVRAWSAALGADWETALANFYSQPADPNRQLGSSIVIRIDAVNPANSAPPYTPSPLLGMQSFGIGVPEPSTFALGALGLAVILWRRRK